MAYVLRSVVMLDLLLFSFDILFYVEKWSFV